MEAGDKIAVYEEIKVDYNAEPNPADFLFLTRSCYGGVVRVPAGRRLHVDPLRPA